jgi:hypothetical protein
MISVHCYEVRPRKDHRGVDLTSDVLPFGRLWYGEPNAISNAIGYAQHYSRSHDAVISVFDDAWQRDRDARAEGRFQRVVKFFNRAAPKEKYELMCPMLRGI